MSTENEMGDEVYQPDDSEVQEDTGLLEPEDTLVDRGVSPETEGYSPPERPLGVEGWGTTAEEQLEGEPLDDRLARERPDIPEAADAEADADTTDPGDREVGDERTGRLLATDEGLGGPHEQELLGRDVGIDSGSAPAEEAAVHTLREEDPDQRD